MRIVKRFLVALLLVNLFCLFSLNALAQGSTTYRLSDLGMSIDVSDDYTVFTRNTSQNDPKLSEWGLTKDYIDSLFQERSIYLDAWDDDISNEIIITMYDSELSNYSIFSDTELSVLASTMVGQFESMGLTWIRSEVYNHSQAKFLKIYISQPSGDSTSYGLEYSTVYDSKTINIVLHSNTGAINYSQEKLLQGIIDSIVFDSAPIQIDTPEYSPSFVYTDSKTGAYFTVPENWVETDFSKEREFLSAKFTSNLENGLTILYGSHDLWNELSDSEKRGYTRSDFNNSQFSKQDIAEMLGKHSWEVSTVYYDGKEYYEVENQSSQEMYGATFSVKMTLLYRFENGYSYSFQTNAGKDSPYYKDFETLVSSTEYPAFGTNSSQTESGTQKTGVSIVSRIENNWVLLLLINLLFTLIIHPVPIWIYRYAIRKKPVSPKVAKKIVIIDAAFVVLIMLVITSLTNGGHLSMLAILVWGRICYTSLTKGYTENYTSPQTSFDNQIIDQMTSLEVDRDQPKSMVTKSNVPAGVPHSSEMNTEDDNYYCSNCGTKLPSTSRFCHKCGTKVGQGG